jgi:predicted XRE-type DNA-binding protein
VAAGAPDVSLSEEMITEPDEPLEEQSRVHRLADVRRRQELTQHQVATVMGVRQPRVSQLESSQLSRLEVATLRAYIQALGGNLLLVAEFGDERLILDS